MQTLLSQLNAVPGVVGSLVCSPDGQVLAQAFPPVFDAGSLRAAASALAESMAGLGTITGSIGMLDLRYANARIVVRPVTGANLLFLCSPSMNLQPLVISASVAAPRVEKLVAARAGAGSGDAPQPASSGSPGRLHAIVKRINAIIERKKLDPFKVRGEIAIRAGFGLGFIDADTPDDPEKMSKLKAAASAVLGEPL